MKLKGMYNYTITKRVRLLFCTVCICLQLAAQTDSAALINSNWKIQKLAEGVYWKAIQFKNSELFNTNQYLNIIEIGPEAKTVKLSIAYSDSLELTSQIATSNNAIAAINGSFFKMRGADPDYRSDLKSVPKKEPAKLARNRSIVYLRANDSLIAENEPVKDGKRKRHQQGVIALGEDGLKILLGDSLNLLWEHQIIAHDVLSTGPVMLLGGITQPIPNDAFCNDRHPRTAVGKKADGTILLFVVDGRTTQSSGMSIPELQATLRWLQCTDAINLDGGGSTAMFISGQPYRGVVNHPSDNKKFDHEGEREVANALLLIPKKNQ